MSDYTKVKLVGYTQRKEINGEVIIERTPRTFIREVVLLKELNKEQIQLNQIDFFFLHHVCRFV